MATSTVQAFTNDMFGTIRTVEETGRVLFCGRDVATALGYANTKDALARHCKGVAKHYPPSNPWRHTTCPFYHRGRPLPADRSVETPRRSAV